MYAHTIYFFQTVLNKKVRFGKGTKLLQIFSSLRKIRTLKKISTRTICIQYNWLFTPLFEFSLFTEKRYYFEKVLFWKSTFLKNVILKKYYFEKILFWKILFWKSTILKNYYFEKVLLWITPLFWRTILKILYLKSTF